MDKQVGSAVRAQVKMHNKRRAYKLRTSSTRPQVLSAADLMTARRELQALVKSAIRREEVYRQFLNEVQAGSTSTGTPKFTKGTGKAKDKKLTNGPLKKKQKRKQDDDSDSEFEPRNSKAGSSRAGTPRPAPSTSKPAAKTGKHGQAIHKKRKRSTDPVTMADDTPKPKQKDQIPIEQFFKYCEAYWRPFKEEDRAFLETKPDKPDPYVIPPLGVRMEHLPADDDIDGVNTVIDIDGTSSNEQTGAQEVLSGRLISAFVTPSMGPFDPDRDLPPAEKEVNGHATAEENERPIDNMAIDERLEEELAFLGLLTPGEKIDWNDRQDDAVCAELRSNQNKLRIEDAKNTYRKQELLKRFEAAMAVQQFGEYLDECDNAVEDCFVARFVKDKKVKKRKPTASADDISLSLDRRRRFREGVGCIFEPENGGTIPEERIYNDDDMEKFVKAHLEESTSKETSDGLTTVATIELGASKGPRSNASTTREVTPSNLSTS